MQYVYTEVVLGDFGSPEFTGNITICQGTYDFIFNFNRNYTSIFNHYGIKTSYLSKGLILAYYMVIHNYRNPYKQWNIFVAWPHLWLKLGMVKPEIMRCETVLNYPRYVTLRYRTIFGNVT